MKQLRMLILLQGIFVLLAAHSYFATGEEFCAATPWSYLEAMSDHPDAIEKLHLIAEQGIASWYNDGQINTNIMNDRLSNCPDTSKRLSIVIHGLPNKYCKLGCSNYGYKNDQADYLAFLQALVDAVGGRPVVHILEPNAISLIADGGCAISSNYDENLVAGIELLVNASKNAEIYADMRFWTLNGDGSTIRVANVVKNITEVSKGKLQSIFVNTGNYRPNAEMSVACDNFQNAFIQSGGREISCIVDTSRNYSQNLPSSEWCNANFGDIDIPSTSNTSFDNLDYFFCLKPIGENDGEYKSHTEFALEGPESGVFSIDHSQVHWDDGYIANENYTFACSSNDVELERNSERCSFEVENSPSTSTSTSSSSAGSGSTRFYSSSNGATSRTSLSKAEVLGNSIDFWILAMVLVGVLYAS